MTQCLEMSGELAEQRLPAWQQGQTGIPMVDACMRSLQHTGYLNFRMRAMLVSFLCHHLEVDHGFVGWRAAFGAFISSILSQAFTLLSFKCKRGRHGH